MRFFWYFNELVKFCKSIGFQALKIGQSIFKSHWYGGTTAVELKPYILFTLARTQIPLEFKAQLFGTISLLQFMKVSFLTNEVLWITQILCRCQILTKYIFLGYEVVLFWINSVAGCHRWRLNSILLF